MLKALLLAAATVAPMLAQSGNSSISGSVKDPAEAVKTGQIVKVKVLNVDAKTGRIGLSIKALMAPQARPQPKKPAPAQPATLEQKLAALSAKWTGKS